jgi:hypothetical protein
MEVGRIRGKGMKTKYGKFEYVKKGGRKNMGKRNED